MLSPSIQYLYDMWQCAHQVAATHVIPNVWPQYLINDIPVTRVETPS